MKRLSDVRKMPSTLAMMTIDNNNHCIANDLTWQSAISTQHTTSSLHQAGEITEEQTRIMQRILAMREEYNLESLEFSGILKYIVERGNYLDNFTQIEDVYFEFAIRLLKQQEQDKWIGEKMFTAINPTKDPEVGARLLKVVEAMRDLNLKGDDMFALAHKTMIPNTAPFKHSSCAVIFNTINSVAQGTVGQTTAPPGSE